MTARVQDLVELKYLAIDAKHLGFIVNGNEGNFDALTATGNNSQTDAYQIIANVNQFTTVTSTNNSCKLPQALGIPNGEYIIRNADSTDNLYLFPFLGDSFNELAANTGITIFPGVTVSAQKIDATKWIVTSGTGGGSSSGTNTGDVTLAGTPNYITIVGQVITRALINLTSHVTGILPVANGGTGTSTLGEAVAWTPTFTGFSTNPSNNDFTYFLIGKMCTLNMVSNTAGTSNSTSFTISLPFTAKTRTNAVWLGSAGIENNSIGQATPGLFLITSGGTTLTVYRDFTFTGWTAAGGKRAGGQITYEVA